MEKEIMPTTVLLPTELKQKIKTIARSQELTFSGYLRKVLKESMKNEHTN